MTDAPKNVDRETGEVITPPLPSFSDWFAEHRNGLLEVECAEALAEVIEGVVMTGKDGSLTVTFKVGTKADMILVTDVVSAKVPTVQEPRLYFRGLNGELTRDNPLQPQLLRNPEDA